MFSIFFIILHLYGITFVFLQFCRWGLLVTGATYGYWRFSKYEKIIATIFWLLMC